MFKSKYHLEQGLVRSPPTTAGSDSQGCSTGAPVSNCTLSIKAYAFVLQRGQESMRLSDREKIGGH